MIIKYPFKALILSLAIIILWSCFNVAFAQAPHITYPTPPQSYPINTSITPLTPSNSAGSVPIIGYGQVSTFAGNGAAGYADGIGTAAIFNGPNGLVTDANGNLYVTDDPGLIRKITPSGNVTTVAGALAVGFANGQGNAARFDALNGIARDATGNIYVADNMENLIRKVTPTGLVSTFAGTNAPNTQGHSVDGSLTSARFNSPFGLVFDSFGNLFVSDYNGDVIRKIDKTGQVTTFAGLAENSGPTDGLGSAARFWNPAYMTIDAANNIYVADANNDALRKITPAGQVTTLITGNFPNLNIGYGVASDPAGNVYFEDYINGIIKKITPAGVISTVAGNGVKGFADGPPAEASFNNPFGLALDGSGNLYVADSQNSRIRKISLYGYSIDKTLPAGLSFDATNGTISGTPTAISPPTQYTITAYNAGGSSQYTITIAVGSSNNATPTVQPPHFTYTTPHTYPINSQITPLIPTQTGGAVPATEFGDVFTFAGQDNTAGYLDGPAATAQFSKLWGIDIDASGNLYAADDIRIRKITPAGVVTTLAGGNPSNSLDGTGTAAGFNMVAGLVVAPSGNIFVGDINNRSIRQITPAGVVTTFAGSGINNFNPVGFTADQSGNLFVADQSNDLIRKFTTAGVASTYAGQEAVAGSVNGPVIGSTFNKPADIKSDGAGNLYIADKGGDMIRKISAAGIASTLTGTNIPELVNGPLAIARFNNPNALALDPPGDVYIADQFNLVIRMINQSGIVLDIAGNNTRRTSKDGIGAEANFNSIGGMVYSNGALFVTDLTCIRKIIVTGYAIDKPLPAGLILDSKTGIISGTPIAISPATTYTITGYNTGGNSSSTVTITTVPPPPPVITYPTPQVYTTLDAIAPLVPTNTGGAAEGYIIDKPLPAGLTLDPLTGTISGTPTVVSPATDYTITAHNAGGTGSFTVNITVIAKILPPQTITFNPLPTKTYGDVDFAPGATSTNNTIPVTYTSDNTAVAIFLNGNIHITGAGATNITASQAGNNDFAEATPVTQVLTVNKAPLTVIADNKTRPVGAPNPTLTATYAGFVYNDTQAEFTELPTITTTAVESSPVGEYPITISGIISADYIINPVAGVLTVTAIPATIVVPNAFTPNGDGFNDLWEIKALVDYPHCMVSVYNRYGSLIFQSKGYSRAWDGTYNGTQVPVGTYYYIIDPGNTATAKLSGSVTVLR